MITNLSVRPTPTNNKAKYLTIALLIGALATGILYAVMVNYKGVVGLVCLALLTAAIFIYTKYLAPVYNYDVVAEGGSYLFVVRQTTGKRTTTLCRIDLASIIRIDRETEADRKAHKTPTGFISYVYCPTLGPDVTYLITSQTRYERAEIRIEASDEFAALLTEYAREAKSLMPDEDEE